MKPLSGPLPERPARSIYAAALEPQIASRASVALDNVPRATIAIQTAAQLKSQFPAIAEWMLPTNDLAVVFTPPDPPVAGWLRRPACLIVRVRADRGTVIGGTVLQALEAGPEEPATSTTP